MIVAAARACRRSRGSGRRAGPRRSGASARPRYGRGLLEAGWRCLEQAVRPAATSRPADGAVVRAACSRASPERPTRGALSWATAIAASCAAHDCPSRWLMLRTDDSPTTSRNGSRSVNVPGAPDGVAAALRRGLLDEHEVARERAAAADR